MTNPTTMSTPVMNSPHIKLKSMTTQVLSINSERGGQVTFFPSAITSRKYWYSLRTMDPFEIEQGKRDSNPQPTVLETATLPIELFPFVALLGAGARNPYLTISVTVPAPMVRPPSRIANFSPLSMATGVMSSPVIEMVSPGITISTPSGRVMLPVTSVVRK